MTVTLTSSTLPLKRLLRSIESGVSVNAVDTPAEADQLGVLKTSCVYTGRFDSSENKAVIPDEYVRVSCPVRAGTLVVSRMNTPDLVGAAGYVTVDEPNLYLPDRLWQVNLDRSIAEPRFVYWWTQSKMYRDQVRVACAGTSSSMQNLDQDSFRSFEIPRVERPEQERIANFLDEQTARIDALIAEKERLLSLLAEQCMSVAEQVLTDVASGARVKLGFHVDLLPGFAFPSEDFSRNPEDIPLLRGVNVAPGSVRWDDAVYWCRDYDPALERFRLQTGDIVFGMDRPWISSGSRVAMVDEDSAGALLLQRVCRLRGGEKLRQRFLFYALASDAFRQSVEVDLTGVSVPHISPEQVLAFKVPVLTPQEQDARCSDADQQTESLHELARHAEGMLNRLREYRSSLISAAVTGQLDLSTFKKAVQ